MNLRALHTLPSSQKNKESFFPILDIYSFKIIQFSTLSPLAFLEALNMAIESAAIFLKLRLIKFPEYQQIHNNHQLTWNLVYLHEFH